jgi:hypothetical protein
MRATDSRTFKMNEKSFLSPFNCPIIRLSFAYEQSDTTGKHIIRFDQLIDTCSHAFLLCFISDGTDYAKVYNSYAIAAILYLWNLCYYTILLSNWIFFYFG